MRESLADVIFPMVSADLPGLRCEHDTVHDMGEVYPALIVLFAMMWRHFRASADGGLYRGCSPLKVKSLYPASCHIRLAPTSGQRDHTRYCYLRILINHHTPISAPKCSLYKGKVRQASQPCRVYTLPYAKMRKFFGQFWPPNVNCPVCHCNPRHTIRLAPRISRKAANRSRSLPCFKSDRTHTSKPPSSPPSSPSFALASSTSHGSAFRYPHATQHAARAQEAPLEVSTQRQPCSSA